MRLHHQNDTSATNELLKRFRKLSYIEAREILEKYQDISKVELKDLIQVCMLSLVIALKQFNGKKGFYSYWKIIATHNMLDEVKCYSTLISGSGFRIKEARYEVDFDSFVASSEDVIKSTDELTLLKRVMDIFEQSEYGFTDSEIRLFINYIHGFSLSELAEKYDLKYATVRQRIKRIIEKLRTILKYSKE